MAHQLFRLKWPLMAIILDLWPLPFFLYSLMHGNVQLKINPNVMPINFKYNSCALKTIMDIN